MPGEIELTEKYERNRWPAVPRPDLKPPAGWSLSLLAAPERVRDHQLSPVGESLAFIWDRGDQSDVYVMPASGGWPARISTDRELVAYWDDEVPQWSPDGRWLAFCIDGHVHVAPAEGGLPVKISDFAEEASTPVWMPDSHGLIVSVERDERTQLLLTDREGAWPRPLVTAPGGDAWDPRPSPDGRLVAYVHRPFDDLNRLDLRLVEVESGQVRALTGASKQKDWEPRWSPDGGRLAFLSQRSGFDEVWLIGPDGENLRQLTHLGADVAEIAWSPDGAQLAATVNRGGAFDLALVEIESGVVTYLRSGKGLYSRPRWSPWGDFLTVEYESPSQPPDIYRVALPGGEQTQLTFSQLPALAANEFVTPEVVGYASQDALQIPAFFYRPARPNRAAVLYPHGGPSGQYIYEWDPFAQYLVAKGYTYLAPNYRGSTGYGVAFEHANYDQWGQGDAQDCLHGARFLRGLDWVDPERLAITGGSYGGYMVACCLSRDPDYLFACGVSKYGDANLATSWAGCNRAIRLYTEMMIGAPARNRRVHLDGSPIYQVEDVRAPVLILHGLLDDVVPPQAAEEWVEALRRADKAYEYKTYTGEPHGFLKRATRLDVYARIERFLDWYLLPVGGES